MGALTGLENAIPERISWLRQINDLKDSLKFYGGLVNVDKQKKERFSNVDNRIEDLLTSPTPK